MSFEPKKRREIEMDELNVKSHLNTSLEVEGISVSEDLIGRTLDAIRLSEANASDRIKINEHKKPSLFRHTRTLVTVAAAALILVVGFNALRTLSLMGMKESKSDNSVAYDDAGKTEMYSLKERAPEDGDTAYTIEEADKYKADSKVIGSIDEDIAEDSLENEETLDMIMGINAEEQAEDPATIDKTTAAGGYMLVFTDIILTEATDVKEITITSRTATGMKSISDNELIDDFYSLMEKRSFMQHTVADTDIYYWVDIISQDRKSEISIGETTMTVETVHDGVVSQSIYSSDDHIMLREDLKALLGN
ncbi:MAG: hypothetical protein GX129_05495 [Clostridiales bacterium]|jgi:hypothetical protein|nr:hypothetical protein [Clostridiales bacterium]